MGVALRRFEALLDPTAGTPVPPPNAGLVRFYWFYIRQVRGLTAALFVFGGLTAILALVALVQAQLATAGIPLIPLIMAIALVSGAAYAVALVSAQTALLESIPAEFRGRVFGVLASIVSTASLAPTLVAGPLSDRVSAPVVLAIVGLGVVSIALWSARLFGPRPATGVPEG